MTGLRGCRSRRRKGKRLFAELQESSGQWHPFAALSIEHSSMLSAKAAGCIEKSFTRWPSRGDGAVTAERSVRSRTLLYLHGGDRSCWGWHMDPNYAPVAVSIWLHWRRLLSVSRLPFGTFSRRALSAAMRPKSFPPKHE